MDEQKVKVLLVEDNPAEARLVQELLAEIGDAPFELEWVDRLSGALERLAEEDFGAVLLDLSLPDSEGMESIASVHQQAPSVPIIVLTGLEEETLALMAVQEGAQDYLFKSLVDGKSLVRTLCYTVERNQMLADLELAQQQEQQQAHLAQMEQLAAALHAGAPDAKPLRAEQADAFAQALDQYGALMATALEQRVAKQEPQTFAALGALVGKIGPLGAAPGDVIDIHATALKSKLQDAPPPKAQAYTDEARRMVVELMGLLADYHRKS